MVLLFVSYMNVFILFFGAVDMGNRCGEFKVHNSENKFSDREYRVCGINSVVLQSKILNTRTPMAARFYHFAVL